MGKKDQKSAATPTPESSNAAPPTPPTPTPPKETNQMTTETPKTETTALATTSETTALATPEQSDRDMMKALAARLPARVKEDVLFLKRPTSEQLFTMIEKLPAGEQDKMMELARKTRPKKQGMHTTRTGFAPIGIRVYQGTGNDPVRPAKMAPGEFYTADSRVLGEKFVGVVLHVFEGRTMWPPKDAGDNQSKAPLCVSMDRIEGSRYGACLPCPNAGKPYNQGGCAKDVTVFLIDQDMTGIYSLQFAKSSFGAGDALVKMLQKSENLWDRWVSFEIQARTEKDRKWFVIKATPVSDGKNPANNNTAKHLHPMFEALSKVIDADVYFPQLADIYDRSKSSTDSAANTGGAAAGDTYDEKALLGNDAGSGDNADYSKDV